MERSDCLFENLKMAIGDRRRVLNLYPALALKRRPLAGTMKSGTRGATMIYPPFEPRFDHLPSGLRGKSRKRFGNPISS
ncbi:hypothetical protein [Sphingomonas xinjiangensis]|uniref:Uncharacterized protein n=1 Tax=Sphingomonas xinjiangensis TaxID=643568 RepID=A0A840YPF5_9SPHN|nr:hypothetical protein [Sphingomonas xinjiangensis]MBB5710071.1 hypothetical protein [Sphingomonas xinjiangensis]